MSTRDEFCIFVFRAKIFPHNEQTVTSTYLIPNRKLRKSDMKVKLGKHINEYRKQLLAGTIQKGYRGLMMYMGSLKNHFENKYSEDFVTGNIHQGFMDFSYFSITPKSLKTKKLKVLVLFDHNRFCFEVGLVGQNKQIQEKYWKLFCARNSKKYIIPPTAEDCVVKAVVIENPDFDDLIALTQLIDKGLMKFIKDITDSTLLK